MTELQNRGQRLKLLLKHYGIKQTTLAQRLGVSRGYVSKIVGGSEPISHNVYEKLSTMFPLLNINWLMRGDGEMLISDTKPGTGEVRDVEPVYGHRPESVLEDLQSLLEYYRQRIENLEKRVSLLEGRVKP